MTTAEIMQKIEKIDFINEQIKSSPGLNDGELKRFREHFTVEYTYDSNAIEGSTLTLNETRLILIEGLTIDKKPLKEHLEAVGHKDAFDYIVDISGKNEPLTEQTIKNIHSLVLVNDAANKGIYRSVPVEIAGALDTPPDPLFVPEKMSELLDYYLNNGHHPIVKIAELHILFERIHPFIDGNGRTGRLLLNLELLKHNYLPINVKFRDRALYISCFKDYAMTNNANKFIEMAAAYQLEELEKRLSVIRQKEQIMKNGADVIDNRVTNALSKSGLSDTDIRNIAALKSAELKKFYKALYLEAGRNTTTMKEALKYHGLDDKQINKVVKARLTEPER